MFRASYTSVELHPPLFQEVCGVQEIDGLHQNREKVFQASPIEWIEGKPSQFRELLEGNTNDSALDLRNLLEMVKLEAKYPDIGKPYYLAYTSINALAITEPSPSYNSMDNGSNSIHWWARKECIRTLGILKFHCEFQRCVATK